MVLQKIVGFVSIILVLLFISSTAFGHYDPYRAYPHTYPYTAGYPAYNYYSTHQSVGKYYGFTYIKSGDYKFIDFDYYSPNSYVGFTYAKNYVRPYYAYYPHYYGYGYYGSGGYYPYAYTVCNSYYC